MSDIWTRKRKSPRHWPWQTPGFVVGAIYGFLFCYLVGAAMMFHFLVTIGYSPQMATVRSVLWMWTARIGTDMVGQGLKDGTVAITRPECPPGSISEWWC